MPKTSTTFPNRSKTTAPIISEWKPASTATGAPAGAVSTIHQRGLGHTQVQHRLSSTGGAVVKTGK